MAIPTDHDTRWCAYYNKPTNPKCKLILSFILAVGFFYAGLLRRKNALSCIALSMAVYAVATFQWFFWGYSLAFGDGSKFIGNLKHFGLMNVDAQPSGVLPSIVFAIYQ